MEIIKLTAMLVIGGVAIYLGLKKDVEPSLLIPLGFGIIVINVCSNSFGEFSSMLYNFGLASNELFPLLLFIGIGAMIDFTPLLSNPKLLIFGLVSQGGIFLAIQLALLLGFSVKDAVSIGTIGTADGPTSLIVSQTLQSTYVSLIGCIAYCYVALVTLIQPIFIRMLTTDKERNYKSQAHSKSIPKWIKILFPILTSVVISIISPRSSSLICMLMFGNLLSECGLKKLSETARTTLVDIITLFLGLSLAATLKADVVISLDTLKILGIGIVAFTCNISLGILAVKIYNLFTRNKLNPMIGAAGISAFPMAARTVQKEGLKYNKQNHLLMDAVAVNLSGQLFSVIIGGLLLTLFV